jgi:hypothetical protein
MKTNMRVIVAHETSVRVEFVPEGMTRGIEVAAEKRFGGTEFTARLSWWSGGYTAEETLAIAEAMVVAAKFDIVGFANSLKMMGKLD